MDTFRSFFAVSLLLLAASAEELPASSAKCLLQTSSAHGALAPEAGGHDVKQKVACGLLACILVLCLVGRRLAQSSQGALSILICAFYVAISVTIDLSIAVQKTKTEGSSGSAYAFNPMCAVVLTELLKLTCSAALACVGQYQKAGDSQARESMLGITPLDVMWFMGTAIIFTFNNILVWVAIGANDMSQFGILRDTMVIWTACLWILVFQAPLGARRWLGIMIILGGLALNHFRAETSSSSSQGGASQAHQARQWGFALVLCMTFCNALGSVTNEKAFKRSAALDINLQNCVLYSGCICATLLVMAFTDLELLLSPSRFLEGFTRGTLLTICLQATAGLLVSRLLKYTDSIMKTVASCIRGPVVVFIAPLLVDSPTDWQTLGSSMLIASGCVQYMLQGPMAHVAKPATE